MRSAGVILAAGGSARLGFPKQLASLDGRPLLQHVLDAAAAAPLDEVVVVLGHRADEVARALSLPPGARIVVNPRHADGQSTSLAAGLAAMPAAVGEALVLLGDQPEVRPAAIRAVLEAGCRSRAPVLRAAYGGRGSHPVLLRRDVWDEAAPGRGDQGARGLVAALAGRVELVEIGGEPPRDVDTLDDLARLRARRRSGGCGAASAPRAASGRVAAPEG